jgi:ComF family protein
MRTTYQPVSRIIVNNWLNIIQKLLPPRCLLCGAPGHDDMDLCQDCRQELPRNLACCYRCGEHFEIAISAPQLCGRCLKDLPSFDETFAPFLYQSEMRHLISRLKFGNDYKNARLLGTLLAKQVAEHSELPECLIPVPLHKQRYHERGFNQSIEIARQISVQLNIPMDLSSCIRSRDTGHQISLPAKQRRKNMRQAFKLVKPIHYKHIAIIDDVMTTGATVSALAKVIKQAGVSRVDVWVCARA